MKSFTMAAVLMAFAAAPAFAQCTDADRKGLESLDRAWGDATNRGDRAAMASFISNEYEGFGATGELNASWAGGGHILPGLRVMV